MTSLLLLYYTHSVSCCLISTEVGNWFGNKGICYKKNIVKAQEEANTFATKRAMQQNQSGQQQCFELPEKQIVSI